MLPATMSACWRSPTPKPWATPARWYAIPMAPARAPTTRAPTAARPGCDSASPHLRKSVQRCRVVDQDAVARDLVRGPLRDQVEQHGVVGLLGLIRVRPV